MTIEEQADHPWIIGVAKWLFETSDETPEEEGAWEALTLREKLPWIKAAIAQLVGVGFEEE